LIKARIAAGCAVLSFVAFSQAAVPPVADFFKNPQLNDLALSPSGRYIAATRQNDKTHHQMLVVIDLGERREAKVLASYNDADVTRVHWVNDDRIVFELGDQSSTYFNQYGRGLFSVSRAGDENPKILVRRDWGPEQSTFPDRAPACVRATTAWTRTTGSIPRCSTAAST
jgi:hypothetical protein